MDRQELPSVAFGGAADRLGFRLHWADVHVMGSLARLLATLGLTPARATALIYVARHEGCDQMALGRALAINRASTMKLVDALVTLGAVERRTGRDRRTNALHLGNHGPQLCAAAEATMRDHDAMAFAALSPDEQAVLRRLLHKIDGATGSAAPGGETTP